MLSATFSTRLMTSVAASALVLATFSGCGDSGSQTAAEHNSSASSASPSINPEEAALKTATTLAASYDYAEALAALEGFSGENIDRARSEISAARDAAVLWEDNSKIAIVFVHSLIFDTSLGYD